VESSREFGIEPSGSMKCWKLSSALTTRDLVLNCLIECRDVFISELPNRYA
jgi:hypothetical protein